MAARKRFYKRSDAPPKDIHKDFKMTDPSRLVDGCYVLGWDPPSGKNLGWAVMKYTDSKGEYVASGFEKVPDDPDQRLVFIYEFVDGMIKKYTPTVASVVERSIGFGWAPAREKLGENTGIIKFAAIVNNVENKPVHTTAMGSLFADAGNKKRAEKKTLTQLKAKEYFPVSLKDKRITVSGSFPHEADAVGFCVGFFIANGIEIKKEEEDVVS